MHSWSQHASPPLAGPQAEVLDAQAKRGSRLAGTYFAPHRSTVTSAIQRALNDAIKEEPATTDRLIAGIATCLLASTDAASMIARGHADADQARAHGESEPQQRQLEQQLERATAQLAEATDARAASEATAERLKSQLETAGGEEREKARALGVELYNARSDASAAAAETTRLTAALEDEKKALAAKAKALEDEKREHAASAKALERANEELKKLRRGGEAAEAARKQQASVLLQSRIRGRQTREMTAKIEKLEAEAGAATKRVAEAEAALKAAPSTAPSAAGSETDAALEAAWVEVDKALEQHGTSGSTAWNGEHDNDAVGKLMADAKFFSFGNTDDFLKGIFQGEELARSMEEEFRYNDDGKFWEEYRYIVYRNAEHDVDADGKGPLSATTAKFLGRHGRGGENIVRDAGHAGMSLQDFVNHPTAVAAGMNTAEVAALRLYPGPAYQPVNNSLRRKDGTAWRTTISMMFSAVLKLSQLAKPARVYAPPPTHAT